MLKRPGAIFPAVGLLIPFERLARIPCFNAGVGIETFHAHQMRKHSLGPLQGLALIDFVRRIGGCDGQDLDIQARTNLVPRFEARKSFLHAVLSWCGKP